MVDRLRGGEEAPAPRHGGRRLRDMAAVLPVAMLLLILPPYIRIFDQDSFLGGVPLLFLYIFGLWALVILVSAVIARGLARREMSPAVEGARAAGKEGAQADAPPPPGREQGGEQGGGQDGGQGRARGLEQGLEREA